MINEWTDAEMLAAVNAALGPHIQARELIDHSRGKRAKSPNAWHRRLLIRCGRGGRRIFQIIPQALFEQVLDKRHEITLTCKIGGGDHQLAQIETFATLREAMQRWREIKGRQK